MKGGCFQQKIEIRRHGDYHLADTIGIAGTSKSCPFGAFCVYLKQNSNKVWAENTELGVTQKEVVVEEAVGSAEKAQASGD